MAKAKKIILISN